MLSLFPELFDWSWYVPFIFRVFLGSYLLCAGWVIIKKHTGDERKNSSIALFCAGILLIALGFGFLVGIFVQALGAVGFALAITMLYFRKKFSFAFLSISESAQFYILIGIVSLSLVFLGPGPFSFDMPL